MNKLPFGSFHATHFSQQQVQQWRLYLQQIQPPISYRHYSQEEAPEVTEEYFEEELWPSVDQADNEDIPPLSKEAIAIFEFSEAYSAQRKQDTSEENDDEKSRQEINSILNISTTLHHDGIEAPAISLVLLSSLPPISQQSPTSAPHQISQSNRISTKQHLLNSAYMESCNQSQNEDQVPLVIWPVLPFRL